MSLDDVAVGSVTGGVNGATFILLNALLGLTVLSLAGLLAACVLGGATALAPHAAALLVLALLLPERTTRALTSSPTTVRRRSA